VSYIVRSVGRSIFKTINLLCPGCEYEEERTIDVREMSDEQIEEAVNQEVRCPNCEEADMGRVWRHAPSVTRYANENSPATFEARKKSYRERFLKKEADDIRNKHGVNFDDSIRSAAAQRIKKGEDPA
jgi:hypothetical protein